MMLTDVVGIVVPVPDSQFRFLAQPLPPWEET